MRFSLLALGLALAPLAPIAMQDKKQDPAPAVAKVGEAAPAIRLNDETGKAVRVGGESDTWTVLAFFPKAATPG